MKNRIKGIMLVFICCIGFILLFAPRVKAVTDLDEIQDYTITVDMRQDGTMDIKYHIEWKVLDSTLEGPLEWVQIGIPNKHVKNIKAISNNIKKIKYNYNYGDYVRIDFKKKYYAGETVTFDFSLNQSYMYTINSGGTCTYQFTPGWFNDIDVKKATIKWNSNSVKQYSGKPKQESGYLVWTKALKKGEKLEVQVDYSNTAFNFKNNKQVKNAKEHNETGVIEIIAVVIVIVVIISMNSIGNPYYHHRGFGGYYYRPYYHHYGGYHHHGGGGFGGGSSRRRTEVHHALVPVLVQEEEEQDAQKRIFMEPMYK